MHYLMCPLPVPLVATSHVYCPLHMPLRCALVTTCITSPCTLPPHALPCPPLVTTHAMLPYTSQSHAPLRCACCSHLCCVSCHARLSYPYRLPHLSHPHHPPCHNHDHDCSNNTPNMQPPPQCDHNDTTTATAM